MTAAAARRLSVGNSVLLICDLQEKFRNAISGFAAVVQITQRMIKGCDILQVPMVATEQYPKGLGRLVPELQLETFNVPVFEKTCFSMMGSSTVLDHMRQAFPDRKAVILCGIEAHVCIYQTVLDLLAKEFDVHLVVDACSSRSQVDRAFALRALERYGAMLTTHECALLALLRDASHPKFREVQALIKEPAPDSGLLR